MIDLSIIILNFQAKEWVRKNLDALKLQEPLLRENGYSYEVVVVDNSDGGDGTSEMVELEYPQFKAVPVKKNIGFPKGNNLGLQKCSGRYILLLNPDSIIEQDALVKMLKFMDSHPDAGAATCKVLLKLSGKVDPATHRGFPTPWASLSYYLGFERAFPKSRLFGQYHQTWKDLTSVHEVDFCSGTFMMIRKEALEAIGGKFSEDYFMYAEDIDTCYQIRKAGWKVYYYPDAVAYHFKGISSGIKKETQSLSKATSEQKRRMINVFWDDNLMFYNKHFKKSYLFLVTWAVYLAIWIKRQIALRNLHV